ncbi:MAG: MlaA family lipoprotein, partial [Gallionella sp.]|nr:MlaA family lipoprotein [Gallionella sp.]
GVFGLLDVTSRLEKHNEDFGQTLGYWGVGSGPYLMLPLLGPSSVRDGVGLYADSRPSLLRRVNHIRTRNQLYLTTSINRRAQLLDQEKVLDEAALDRYEFIRDAYLLRRQSLVYDGNPPREKYDDEENDFEYQQVPIPGASSSRQHSTPVARHASTAQLAAPRLDADLPNVHKVWIAQRTGIR